MRNNTAANNKKAHTHTHNVKSDGMKRDHIKII